MARSSSSSSRSVKARTSTLRRLLVSTARLLRIENPARQIWRNVYAARNSWRGSRTYRRIGRTIDRDVFVARVGNKEVRFLTVDAFSKFHFFASKGSTEGAREQGLTAQLSARLQSARCFADVGAHVGYFTCIASALNPALKVFAFELDRLNADRLRENVRLNGCTNVEIVHAAVTESSGEITYARPPEAADMPYSTLTIAPPSFHRVGVGEERVAAISLDDFFRDRGVMPDIVKIDVEGAEYSVLRGMEQLIRSAAPTIFIELHPAALPRFGHSVANIVSFLSRHGYELCQIPDHRSGSRTDLIPVEDDRLENLALLVALPRGAAGGSCTGAPPPGMSPP